MGLTLLDTSVVVGLLDRDDALHVAAADAIERELDARQTLALSAVSWAEVLSGAARVSGAGFDGDRFLERGGIPVLPVDRAVAETAAVIRRRAARGRRRVRTPDALVLGTADAHPDVDRVLTADAQWRGLRLDGARIVVVRL